MKYKNRLVFDIRSSELADREFEWGRRRREGRWIRCGATTATGSLKTRRYWCSIRRPSTSSAMFATRSSPPPAAWPSMSFRSTRNKLPSPSLPSFFLPRVNSFLLLFDCLFCIHGMFRLHTFRFRALMLKASFLIVYCVWVFVFFCFYKDSIMLVLGYLLILFHIVLFQSTKCKTRKRINGD